MPAIFFQRRLPFQCFLAALLAVQCLLSAGFALAPAGSDLRADDSLQYAVLQDSGSESALREFAGADGDDAVAPALSDATAAVTRQLADGTSPSARQMARSFTARGPPPAA